MTIEVRTARREDDGELARIDAATWTTRVSPAPPPGEQPFFGIRLDPESVLVAQINDQIVGYVALGNSSPLRSRWHVLDVRSIAVDPAHLRKGVGRRLLEEAIEEARRRGAHKLTLRVLSTNEPARDLYDSCGFVIEGNLRDEYRLEGQYVDDVLMAHPLTQSADLVPGHTGITTRVAGSDLWTDRSGEG